jgi:hypothetical protein
VNGPLFSKPDRRTLFVWASLACLNLTAGLVVSSRPQRLFDLETMQRWGGEWLVEGTNIYFAPDWAVDYPPNAIVLLSPLGLAPLELAHPLWMMLNIGMAALAAYFAARFYRPHDPFRVVLLPILMFLCWGGVRTLTQFSLAALVCSMAALKLADRSRVTSGVWLGAAMMKPQVAVPVFLWSVFTRRRVVALTSVAAAGALFAAFCLRSHAGPLLVISRYADVLATLHAGDAILSGASELRPLVAGFASDLFTIDALAIWIAVCLLAAICVAGMQEGRARRAMYAAPPLAACWSLLTFYHLTYGFVVLLPVMMLLALNDTETSLLRRALFWLLQLGMMFDIPGISRYAGLADTALYANVLSHADRVLILIVFAGLAVLAWQESGSDCRSSMTDS